MIVGLLAIAGAVLAYVGLAVCSRYAHSEYALCVRTQVRRSERRRRRRQAEMAVAWTLFLRSQGEWS